MHSNLNIQNLRAFEIIRVFENFARPLLIRVEQVDPSNLEITHSAILVIHEFVPLIHQGFTSSNQHVMNPS